jgi:hypothetical protein
MNKLTSKQKILIGALIILLIIIISIILFFVLRKKNRSLWPPNSIIIGPNDDMAKAQQKIDNIYTAMGGYTPNDWNGQFSDKRWAIMFLPGTYHLTINIGYYTTIIGLGQSPDDVIITGNVFIKDGSLDKTQGGLSNFWRSCENLSINPTQCSTTVPQFSVSQACPLRRLNVNCDLFLFQQPTEGDASFTSGGFLADSKITGDIHSGSQQQFMTRNTSFNKWGDSVWNEVFAGCTSTTALVKNCPPLTDPKKGFNAITDSGPVKIIAEKPYIVYGNSSFSIFVPAIETDKNGPTTDYTKGVTIPFSKVFVAWAEDSADTINKEINKGNHIVFTPGIYNLDKSINVPKSDTILLGTGMATLVSGKGQPCVIIGDDTEGVRVSGLLLQAGKIKSQTLLQWGLSKTKGSSSNPGIIQDVFARVGGPDYTSVSTGSMMEINQSYVIIDNTWLWVADHGNKVGYGINTSDHGLIVNGDNVSAYGLMVEHNDNDNVLWNGNNGFVSMYQSEFRYDLPNTTVTSDIVSLRVSESVTDFNGWGMGAYCFFPNDTVVINNGFMVPPNQSGVKLTNLVTVFLDGTIGSKIGHVINDSGNSVWKKTKEGEIQQEGQLSYVCNYPPPTP